MGNPASTPPTPPTNFFYAFGNSPANPAFETGTPSPTTYYPAGNGIAANTPSLVQYLSPAADPFNGQATPAKITWYPGVLPGVVADSGTSPGSPPSTYQSKLPTLTAGSQQTKYYWVCLRRPANPFAPVSAANPMLVVDAMRFPYIDGTVDWHRSKRTRSIRPSGSSPIAAATPSPSRRAHRPAWLPRSRRWMPATATPSRSRRRRDISYLLGTQVVLRQLDHPIYHTLGIANDQAEPWDYFPFHDRDFTGVAELMLVPGCPPGLFTKQFAEFAPSRSSSGHFAQVEPKSAPPPTITAFDTAATAFVTSSATNNVSGGSGPEQPHTFPYLVDRFFYTGASSAADTGGTLVGSPTGDGWFKMFEFFEVPGQMMGATGPVAQGTNFDWDRQDTKPGLLNLNLIIDEEVFFSVVGQQDAGFNQQWLNFIQVPSIPSGTYSLPLNGQAPIPQYGPPVPLVVTAIDANGSPAYVYPITNQGVTGTDPILAALEQVNPTVPAGRSTAGSRRPSPSSCGCGMAARATSSGSGTEPWARTARSCRSTRRSRRRPATARASRRSGRSARCRSPTSITP